MDAGNVDVGLFLLVLLYWLVFPKHSITDAIDAISSISGLPELTLVDIDDVNTLLMSQQTNRVFHAVIAGSAPTQQLLY